MKLAARYKPIFHDNLMVPPYDIKNKILEERLMFIHELTPVKLSHTHNFLSFYDNISNKTW